MYDFNYQKASSVADAAAKLGAAADGRFLSGGMTLLPTLKQRLAQPSDLVDLGGIADLVGITVARGWVSIGAMTPHAAVNASADVKKAIPALAKLAGGIGDPQVRNRGTVGGNVAHADPASDLPAVLVALGATVHLQSLEGNRSVTAKDFFVDLLTTDLGEKEILTSIDLPVISAGTGSCYLKFEHPASGYAVVGAAAWIRFDADASNGQVEAAGLAFNGVTATPLDASEAVSALVGGEAEDHVLKEVCDQLTAEDPLGDVFASGDYRVQLARVYGRRALATARDRARG